ncbi:MAG: hypothetical protein COA42_08210 [Alteromonadaceae bacterium]|nr:MAG: hypothetical protein COA42_08210 [Alteromonadaceae bacterium]
MKQQQFEQRYHQDWEQLEQQLEGKSQSLDQDFPSRYRQLCHQLALAKHRRYSQYLLERLNRLVLAAHHRFYQNQLRTSSSRSPAWVEFLLWGFPQSIRANAVFVYWSMGLFLVPLFAMGIATYLNGELLYSFMPAQDVHSTEYMYDPVTNSGWREPDRDSTTDLMMFGFYIKNNIGIGFQTFAGGIFLCLGAIFFLVYNGLAIGGVAGHLTQLGYIDTFYPFVVGHGAFELTAIVFAGAAGLKLGCAIISPGQHSRVTALRLAATDAIQIVFGVFAMLLIAAFLEAFWSSSSTIGNSIKYIVGGCFWGFVIVYFVYSGRRHES